MHKHIFNVQIEWSPKDEELDSQNKGRTFTRSHTVYGKESKSLRGSAAKQFHGDASHWNPEELFLASVSQCHMLTFLFLAHKNKIKILSYSDSPKGFLELDDNGIGGQFTEIVLNPTIIFAPKNTDYITEIELIQELNNEVDKYCFIKRSVACSIKTRVTVSPG